MLQHYVVENSLAQKEIFNITNVMGILHQYHAKYELKFNLIK